MFYNANKIKINKNNNYYNENENENKNENKENNICISTKIVYQRIERQVINNKLAYNSIKLNSKNSKKNDINEECIKKITNIFKL